MGGKGTESLFFDNQIDEIDSSANEVWMTTSEAASYLRVSEASLRNMSSNGSIPYYKLGRRNRYKLSDLKSLLLRNRKGGNNHGN
jgi:excisionase family DNA binding protein